jgi:hypothetical protein
MRSKFKDEQDKKKYLVPSVREPYDHVTLNDLLISPLPPPLFSPLL